MPRGQKRDHNGELTPKVGEVSNRRNLSKRNLIQKGRKTVARNGNQCKQSPKSRRLSKRVVKAKRKLDFVYDGDKVEAKKINKQAVSKNNNACLDLGKVRKLVRNQESKVKHEHDHNRVVTVKNKFDGIQISLNSDEEELDYDDIVSQEEEGSIDQLSENGEENNNAKNDTTLGTSSSNFADEQTIMNNPHLHKLLNKMLDERIKIATSGECSLSQLLSKMTPTNSADKMENVNKVNKDGSDKKKKTGKQGMSINVVKSPSDTTIYAPALKRITRPVIDGNIGINLDVEKTRSIVNKQPQTTTKENNISKEPELISKISNFVDQLRIEFDSEGNDSDEQQTQQMARPRSSINAPGLEEAQKRMEQAIETEKFQAAVERPPSMSYNYNTEQDVIQSMNEPEVLLNN